MQCYREKNDVDWGVSLGRNYFIIRFYSETNDYFFFIPEQDKTNNSFSAYNYWSALWNSIIPIKDIFTLHTIGILRELWSFSWKESNQKFIFITLLIGQYYYLTNAVKQITLRQPALD